MVQLSKWRNDSRTSRFGLDPETSKFGSDFQEKKSRFQFIATKVKLKDKTTATIKSFKDKCKGPPSN